MKDIILQTYNNYVEAHVARGMLEEAGIRCWLKDENTVTIDPILSNAIGGIKLMVAESQAGRAADLLREVDESKRSAHPCPKCGSLQVEEVSTPRKAANWLSALLGLFVTSYAMPVDMVYHCFSCGHEWNGDTNPNN